MAKVYIGLRAFKGLRTVSPIGAYTLGGLKKKAEGKMRPPISHRGAGHTEVGFFIRYKTSGNDNFFPEAKTYAVVHVVDERGFEAV